MKGKNLIKEKISKSKVSYEGQNLYCQGDIHSGQNWSYGPSIAQPHLILRNPLLDISSATVLYFTCCPTMFHAVACMVCKVKFTILYKVTQFAFKIRQKFVKLHL